jgi:hypothetical protein
MHLPGCKAIRDARGLEVTMALSAYLRLVTARLTGIGLVLISKLLQKQVELRTDSSKFLAMDG